MKADHPPHVGACGKEIDHMCYPLFEDDLCGRCQFNGWIEMREEQEMEAHEVEA